MQRTLTVIFLVAICSSALGQIDSLDGLTLERVLDEMFQKSDTTVLLEMSDYVKKRARNEGDSIAVSMAHYTDYLFNDESKNLPFLDSMIHASKGTLSGTEILALVTKGDYYYEKNVFNKALPYYLDARELSSELNHEYYLTYSTRALADLKFLAGEFSEALDLYHRHGNLDADNRLQSIFNIANCHYELGNLDSLLLYSTKGIRLSKQANDTVYYQSFLKLNGVLNYMQGNFSRALDSLQKSRAMFVDTVNIASSYYFTALSYESLNVPDSSLIYLGKIAALHQEPQVFFPEIKDVYFKLYENARERDDYEDQLKFIGRYIEADSILQSKSNRLISKIGEDFDLPLFQEKRSELRGALKSKEILSFLVAALSIFCCFLILYFLIKSRRQKARLKHAKGNPEGYLKIVDKGNQKPQKKGNPLPNHLVENLDIFFERFENDMAFLDPSLSLQKLAGMTKSNTSYVSNYLNTYKGGYNQYINGLRTEFAFRDISINPDIKKYTLQHIAKMYGFSSLRGFNRAFENFLKIRPKDYIAQFRGDN